MSFGRNCGKFCCARPFTTSETVKEMLYRMLTPGESCPKRLGIGARSINASMHGLLPANGLKVFKPLVVEPDLEWVFH